jgi:hypothetical protein
MATLSNVVCLVIHRNVIHRFIVQALQDPPLCSSTVFPAEELVTSEYFQILKKQMAIKTLFLRV